MRTAAGWRYASPSAFSVELSCRAYTDFGSLENDTPLIQNNRRKCAAEFTMWMQYRIRANRDWVDAGDLRVLCNEDRRVQYDGRGLREEGCALWCRE